MTAALAGGRKWEKVSHVRKTKGFGKFRLKVRMQKGLAEDDGSSIRPLCVFLFFLKHTLQTATPQLQVLFFLTQVCGWLRFRVTNLQVRPRDFLELHLFS